MKSPCAVNLHHTVTVSQQRLGKRVAQLSSAQMNEHVCRFALLGRAANLVSGDHSVCHRIYLSDSYRGKWRIDFLEPAA